MRRGSLWPSAIVWTLGSRKTTMTGSMVPPLGS